MTRLRILFVCLGNICRSPAAESVMRKLCQTSLLNLEIDSAGTSSHHAGELADSRMIQHAKKRDIQITSISRQFTYEDFLNFDHIIVMDNNNYKNVMSLDTKAMFLHKVSKMTDYCSEKFKEYDHVPDPYFGGDDGFELVLDILEDSCSNFLRHINLKL